MKRVFLFNPENDIALASGRSNFTPPKNAALLAVCGTPLLSLIADDGDFILVPPFAAADAKARFTEWGEANGVKARFVSSLVGLDVEELVPWGWSDYSLGVFRRAGAGPDVIERYAPRLERHRELSSRCQTAEITHRLISAADGRCPALWHSLEVPVEARNIEEVQAFGREHKHFYVKAPWSSSGRGVFRGDELDAANLENRCRALFASQGSVMLEPAYDKAVDFAMLFESNGSGPGRVKLLGYSLFFNSHGASYGGNIVASDDDIKDYLERFVPAATLDFIARELEKILGETIDSGYKGHFGVDMMIVRADGGFMVVPCVELNLRLTMGIMARLAGLKHGIGCHPCDSGRIVMRVEPSALRGSRSCRGSVIELVPPGFGFDMYLSAESAD